MSEGMEVVKRFQKEYIEHYLTRMKWVGIGKTEENLTPDLAVYLGREEAQPGLKELPCPFMSTAATIAAA